MPETSFASILHLHVAIERFPWLFPNHSLALKECLFAKPLLANFEGLVRLRHFMRSLSRVLISITILFAEADVWSRLDLLSHQLNLPT